MASRSRSLSEGLAFIEAGFGDVTVAYPVLDPRKIGRLLAAVARHGAAITLIVDSPHGVTAIRGAAADRSGIVDVQVKVDVGLHRCGVEPSGEAALELARRIADSPRLRFAGLLSHAGHAYAAASAEAVAEIAAAERATMLELADRIKAGGIDVPSISVGSTPTLWLNRGLEGITELRPGNYVFMDLTQVCLGVATREDVAIAVYATVVSRNETYAIIDAGSKSLSSDRGPHGSTRLEGYGMAFRTDTPDGPAMPVARLSEEHGFVLHGGQQLPVGAQVKVLPNHSCTVVNLATKMAIAGSDGDYELLPVDARACVT
jgi:D-serine deaminase-like pyridoxal phosphate-dependent protein